MIRLVESRRRGEVCSGGLGRGPSVRGVVCGAAYRVVGGCNLTTHAVEVPLRGGYCPRAVSCGRSRLCAPTSRPVSFLFRSTCARRAHLRAARLSSSSQYLLRLLSYRPIGRSFASRHSYRPRTVRSTAAAPTTIADRFAPAYSLRSTYRIAPWRRRTLRTVSSYPPPAASVSHRSVCVPLLHICILPCRCVSSITRRCARSGTVA